MRKNRSFCFNLIQISLLTVFVLSCQSEDNLHLIESWGIGTYTGILDDFEQEALQDCKSKGIQYLEISSGTFRGMTDEERIKLVDDIKMKVENADLEIWSIHLPYSKIIDVSTTDEET